MSNWSPEALDALDKRIINGHPTARLTTGAVIYVCANCERIGNVLFLSEDRWICTSCKNEGYERPTFVPMTSKGHP